MGIRHVVYGIDDKDQDRGATFPDTPEGQALANKLEAELGAEARAAAKDDRHWKVWPGQTGEPELGLPVKKEGESGGPIDKPDADRKSNGNSHYAGGGKQNRSGSGPAFSRRRKRDYDSADDRDAS